MTDEKKEKMTALIPSVGADGGQPPLCNETILTDNQQDGNHERVEMEEMEAWLRQIRQMNSPDYLHTVSLTELYDTVYRSRIPVIENLLYTGAYISDYSADEGARGYYRTAQGKESNGMGWSDEQHSQSCRGDCKI